jgi:hypothetical protein
MANLLASSGLGTRAKSLMSGAESQIKNSISAIKSSLIPKSGPKPNNKVGELVYPATLRGQLNANMILFTVYDSSGEEPGVTLKHVFLPCPANIAINDSATYNTVDLGVIGGATAKAMEDSGGNALGFAGSLLNQMKGSGKSFGHAEIVTAMGAKIPGAGAVTGVASLKNRTLLNPNTNTLFSGNALRSFSFAFKMIATSNDESLAISEITHRFREYTYADSRSSDQNLILAFPPTWTIHFLDGHANENKFIPKIHSCYLTGVGSTFNSTTNMFHSDGAPLEVDISLSFQETRALNRTDITQLRKNQLGMDRGIDDKGRPTTSAGNGIASASDEKETLEKFQPKKTD